MSKAIPSVLFVCTGNICRSPTAQALLLRKAAAQGIELRTDSAAVTDEEVGNLPDRRALEELQRRGVPMPPHRARMIEPRDYQRFDLILGMTAHHVCAIERMAPPRCSAQVGLLMQYAQAHGPVDVPDPWYGGPQDFVKAFDMIEAGVDGLLRDLAAQRGA